MKNSKKYLIFILVMMLVVAMAFTLTCCNKNDKKSDNPSGEQQSQDEEETKIYVTIDDDFDVSEDGTLSCAVPNATNKFSLGDKFLVSSKVTMKVYYSPDGVTLGEEIKNYDAILNEGENYFIVLLSEGDISNSYLVVIYRQKHYTVTFESSPAIPSQEVLDGACAVVPTITPTRIGCTFDKWDFDFSTPITKDVTIKPLWKPNQYTITYDPDGGEMEQTTQTVTYGEDVTFLVPTKNGYQFKDWFIGGSKQEEGVWTRTTDVEFVAKWEIVSLSIVVAPSLSSAGTLDGSGEYVYDEECTITATPFKGYRFEGWLDENGDVISEDSEYTFAVENNMRIVAQFNPLVEEMAPFLFITDDEESYIISGIRDTKAVEVTIPDCVVAIQENALELTHVKSLTIPFIGSCAANAKYASRLDLMFRKGVPSTLRTVHVTGECYIGTNTFSSAKLIETIVLDDVRRIDDKAFINNKYLKNLTVSDSLVSVGENLFFTLANSSVPYRIEYTEYNNGLYFGTETNPYLVFIKEKEVGSSSVIIHEDTKAISKNAFYSSSERQGDGLDVVLPDGLVSVGDFAFKSCKIASINFPDTLKYIGNEAFKESLKDGAIDLIFGNVLETIGDGAFSNCTAIRSLVLPDSLTSLGESAFYYCNYLENLTIGKGLKTIKENTFYYAIISNLIIPDNVERIEKDALGRVQSISIGKGLKYCETQKMWNLETISISSENEYFYGTGCLIEKATDNLIIGSGAAILPEGLKTIGDCAFYCNNTISSAIIPSTVTSIGRCAFYSCENLTELSIPDGIKDIGESAFPRIASKLENNVYYCGNADNSYMVAFALSDRNCTSVVFNEKVKFVLMGIFDSCENIESITCPESAVFAPDLLSGDKFSKLNNTVDGIVYRGTSSNPYLYVAGCEGDNSSYEIKAGAKEIGRYAFIGKSNITQITLPDSVEIIGQYAFGNCSGLQNVVLGNGIKTIGRDAFNNCSNLESITFPSTLTTIEEYAFAYCSRLSNVTIPGSVESVGSYAFYGCEGMQSVTLSEGLKSIKQYAFYSYGEYNQIVNLELPSTLTEIGECAFYCWSGLKGIRIPASVKTIGNSAFSNNKSLESVVIKEGVEKIEQQAFGWCDKLETVTIPASVKFIGEIVFASDYALTDVNYAGTRMQWLQIEKESGWQRHNHQFTVHCSDGDLTYYGSYGN